jgi:hypothetical protein
MLSPLRRLNSRLKKGEDGKENMQVKDQRLERGEDVVRPIIRLLPGKNVEAIS